MNKKPYSFTFTAIRLFLIWKYELLLIYLLLLQPYAGVATIENVTKDFTSHDVLIVKYFNINELNARPSLELANMCNRLFSTSNKDNEWIITFLVSKE